MFKAQLGEHPSAKLQRGEAQTFPQAMRLVRAQFEYEQKMGKMLTLDEPVDQYPEIAATRKAQAIYAEIIRKAEADVVAALRAMDDSNLAWFADALESGDYSQLAI